MSAISKDTTFLGYRRENGRVGVRNHVAIQPLDDLSNAAAEAVAHNIKGALAIPHPYGRRQFGADLDLHFRTLIGAGSNPNVAAAVVIGVESGWTQKLVEGIKLLWAPPCALARRPSSPADCTSSRRAAPTTVRAKSSGSCSTATRT